jgi:methylamine dehydrogenase heavy chain
MIEFKGLRMLKKLSCCLLLLCSAMLAHADLPLEKPSAAVLGDHAGKHWFWVWGVGAPAMIDGHAYLFDDSGKQLGQLSAGVAPGNLFLPSKRNEVFSVQTYFSRGTTGQRTDLVAVYDATTLHRKREIQVPPKRMTAINYTGLSVMSDDERFLLLQNYTPAQTISIVDLDADAFVTEVETPGCASIYPAGPRDFYSICGDGGFFHLRIDDAGHPVLRERVAPLFDPVKDFLAVTASRLGSTWYFVSSQNNVYALDMTATGIKLTDKWSLVSDSERADNWRISGMENTAIHRDSGRLFVLMHQGGADTRKDPASEVWAYNLKTHSRVARFELNDMTLSLAVSQGPNPRLYTVDFIVPLPYLAKAWIYLTQGKTGIMKVMQQGIGIYDAQTGKTLHQITGLQQGFLSAALPWGGGK